MNDASKRVHVIIAFKDLNRVHRETNGSQRYCVLIRSKQ